MSEEDEFEDIDEDSGDSLSQGLDPEELEQIFKALQVSISKHENDEVSVEFVDVEGVKRTKSWVLGRLAIPLMKCKTLAEILREAEIFQVNLARLEIFSKVDVTVKSSEEGSGLDILAKVKERRLISGSTGMTVGNNEGTADFKIFVTNYLGVADRFTFRSSKSSQGAACLDLSFMLPVAGSVDHPFTLTAFQNLNDFPPSSHKQMLRGVSAEYQTHSIIGTHTLRYECTWRHVRDLHQHAPFPIRELAGHSLKSALRHVLLIDLMEGTRRQGVQLRLDTECAGGPLGGDVPLLRATAELAARMPVQACDVGLTLRAGALWTPLAQSHISDRFFLGGAHDIRGFAIRGIGPRAARPVCAPTILPPAGWPWSSGGENGGSLGGDAFWAAGAHLWTPLPFASLRARLPSLRMHFFGTAGSLAPAAKLDLLQQDVAASCGAGVSFDAGSFTVELNYCRPLRFGIQDMASPGLQFAVGFNLL